MPAYLGSGSVQRARMCVPMDADYCALVLLWLTSNSSSAIPATPLTNEVRTCCRPAGALVAAARRLMPAMPQQELCNTVWALGVLELLDREVWEDFCNCLAHTQGACVCFRMLGGRCFVSLSLVIRVIYSPGSKI